MTRPIVRVATDLTGMGTPLLALRAAGIKIEHVFASDPSVNAQASIAANFPPNFFYEDIASRDAESAPAADVYVASFPCQPFSPNAQVHQDRFLNEAERDSVFIHIRKYIAAQQPKVFLLESVAGLATVDGGKYLEVVLDSLKALGTYSIHARALDTKDHGVPQSRGRFYLIGIAKAVDKGTFAFPEAVERPDLDTFLLPRRMRPTLDDMPPESQSIARSNVQRAIKELQEAGFDPFGETWIVDCDSPSGAAYARGVAPCLTSSRASGHWITNRGRRMTKMEMMMLQGIMAPSMSFRTVVSDLELGRQLGNAGSVNVLERLFVRLLPAAGLVEKGSLIDRWEPAPAVLASPPPRPVRQRVEPELTPSPLVKRLRFERA